MNTSILSRTVSLAASVVLSLAIVTLIADYAIADHAPTMLAQAQAVQATAPQEAR